jgi:hypothetical protein
LFWVKGHMFPLGTELKRWSSYLCSWNVNLQYKNEYLIVHAQKGYLWSCLS